MIKVLHVFNIMNKGGAETMIMNIYRNINREAIQFDFLCFSKEKGAYDDEISELGGEIYRLDYYPKHFFKHINQMVKHIKKNGPYKAIHIPMSFYSGIIAFIGWFCRIPIRIVHSHTAGDNDKNSILRKIYFMIMRGLISIFATHKFSCGKAASDFLFGKKAKKVLILNNCIELNKYTTLTKDEANKKRKELNINSNAMIVGNVARFVELKNQKFFLKLAQYYKQNSINAKIVLVGDGELKDSIEIQIKENGLEDYLICIGLRSDIPELMNMFDVLVMPSIYEGFPVTVIEALAAGKNCVLSDGISKEVACIKGAVEFISLNENIEIWAQKIEDIKNRNVNRQERINELSLLGFDANQTSRTLTQIYES